MYRYRVKWTDATLEPAIVKADALDGLYATSDTYIFKMGEIIVAAIPKVAVLSIEKINGNGA